jgi:thiamine biosynthesis lipoprotein
VTTVARTDWKVWSCDASVVVTSALVLEDATRIVRDVVGQVDDACSRFRADSELSKLASGLATGMSVSPMLVSLVEGALRAAALSDGDVDPTMGNELASLGYDRDISELSVVEASTYATVDLRVSTRRPRWQDVRVNGLTLTVPSDIRLDLGATAKAIAADLAAAKVAEQLGVGALVSLGGDIATAGNEPVDGWEVLVQDVPEDPSQQVSLAPGAAMATSSTQKRRWMSGGYARHHILDPRFGLPAEIVWRTVTVASSSCLDANALSTASVIRGFGAVRWLEDLKVAARLVDAEGRVVTTSLWPVATPELSTVGGAR